MFEISHTVDVKNRDTKSYGKITAITDNEATVHFKDPIHPKVCASCGVSFNLSQSGNTGEIVCMRTGCGHGHGFEERDEIISLDKLINITVQRLQEKKVAWLKKLRSTLEEGTRGGFVPQATVESVIEQLGASSN